MLIYYHKTVSRRYFGGSSPGCNDRVRYESCRRYSCKNHRNLISDCKKRDTVNYLPLTCQSAYRCFPAGRFEHIYCAKIWHQEKRICILKNLTQDIVSRCASKAPLGPVIMRKLERYSNKRRAKTMLELLQNTFELINKKEKWLPNLWHIQHCRWRADSKCWNFSLASPSNQLGARARYDNKVKHCCADCINYRGKWKFLSELSYFLERSRMIRNFEKTYLLTCVVGCNSFQWHQRQGI